MYGSGSLLVIGGLSILFGVFPVIGALAVAIVLFSAPVLKQDFWAVSADEQQTEMTQFLKTVALAGDALARAVLAIQNWPYALALGGF